MDKAGAYGIQGQAAKWIPRVEGCYFNVMGLPLALVATLLEGRGISAQRPSDAVLREP
jgi:septum formation protein